MLRSTLNVALFVSLASAGFIAGLNGDYNTAFASLTGAVTALCLSC